jgi:hypothetical protein
MMAETSKIKRLEIYSRGELLHILGEGIRLIMMMMMNTARPKR